MVFVVAIHEIEDVVGFWAAADLWPEPPGLLRLHGAYSLVNGSRAVCLWEGESADSVGDYVEQVVGDFGSSEFYEIDPLNAYGLPG
jgi:hypothetical protein